MELGRQGRGWIGFVLTLGCFLALGPLPAAASDSWPGLRGPSYDGAVRDGHLLEGDGGGLEVAWKRSLGPGYSVPTVGGGRVVTLFAAGEDDVIAAFDEATGEELWRYSIAKTYLGHDGSHDGPVASPVLSGDKVFGLGPRGDLFALQAKDGKKLWARNLAKDFEAEVPFYGFGSSPVAVGDILVVAIGGKGHSIAGLSASTGEVRWSFGDQAVEFNSPVVADLGGRRQVVVADGKTLFGVDPADGSRLWSHEHGADQSAMGGATIIPIPAGENRILLLNKMSSSSMLQVTSEGSAFKVEELWSSKGISRTYVQPVYHEGYFYGMVGRIFTCVDAATGETVWRSREPGDGFPTLIGDQLAILTKPGILRIAKATSEGYQELTHLDLFEEQSWSAIAFADGRLYARSMGYLARVEPTATGAAEPKASKEAPTWVAATDFGRFLESLESAADPSATLATFLEQQEAFPIVEAGGVVHFVFQSDAPVAAIVGDMIGFRREDPMIPIAGTDYFYYSSRLEPDAIVAYGFIPAYGEVEPDPRNPRKVSGLFGKTSWFAMPAWEPPVYDGAETPAAVGRLETLKWELSKDEGGQRKATVYLPPGYDSSRERYPVAYFLDGTSALEEGETVAILDNLVGSTVEPLIAVFLLSEAQPDGPPGAPDGFVKAVAGDLVARVDAGYRTLPDRWHRAVVGMGVGSGTAFTLSFRHGETFGKVAALGAGFFNLPRMSELVKTADETPLELFLGWGTYDLRSPHEAWDMVEESRGLWSLLRERGYRPAGGETSDGAGWYAWKARTDDWLRALFPLTAQM